jgi:UDP-N-acetylmuramoylalanine--D-glutamate ligase
VSGPVLVVGLGVMGRAVVTALTARGVEVICADDRPHPDHEALAAATGARYLPAPSPEVLAEALRVVTEFLPTPGLPERHPAFALARVAGVPVISEFDLAARWDQRPLVAVTGTNGKTTVTMMVTAMLERSGIVAAAVGNTDVPLVAAIDDPTTEVFVVEASSFRLAASRRFKPRAAAWLNFAPDHLDVHASLAAYEAAKARIWADQGPGDVAIGNAGDPVVARHLAAAPGRHVPFSPAGTGGYRVSGGALVAEDGAHLAAVADLPRALPHDLANGLAAAATARAGGAAVDACGTVLSTWTNLAHRVQFVAEAGGVRFYDDSKATTPHAVLAAVSGFESVVLVAGGYNKGLDLAELAAAAPRVRAVVAIGAAAGEVTAAFAGLRPVVEASSMDAAVARAADLAEPGDAVLLSPGTASFDWYRNYGERGDDFTRAVRDLLAERAGGGQR